MHLHIYVINMKQYSIQITEFKNKYILDAIPLTKCMQNKNMQIALKEK